MRLFLYQYVECQWFQYQICEADSIMHFFLHFLVSVSPMDLRFHCASYVLLNYYVKKYFYVLLYHVIKTNWVTATFWTNKTAPEDILKDNGSQIMALEEIDLRNAFRCF